LILHCGRVKIELMKFAHRLAHLFFPRESNNHKAKLIHSSSLTIITFALVLFQLVLTFLPKLGPSILGYAANIPPSEVIRLSNEKRVAAGLPALTENGTLSQAAQAKGADMLNKGYWAHVAPDGTQPWKFFTDVGYKYRYAGENLARDFSNSASAVEAWMASPSHRENLMSPKYKEIGVAVVEGQLAGVETTIIVQLFGTQYADSLPAVPVAEAKTQGTNTTLATPTAKPVAVTDLSNTEPTTVQTTNLQAVTPKKSLLSPFLTTRNLSLLIVCVLLVVLVVDGIVTNKRGIARIGGKSFAHVAFLGMILAIVLILKAGQII